MQITLPRKLHHCPQCGSSHTIVSCYHTQTLKGITGCKMTFLYRCRRYQCQDCGKTFVEERPFIQLYQRMPDSVIESIVQEHGDIVTETQIAHRHGVSVPTVMRHFAKAMKKAEADEAQRQELPEVLSMDEFRGNVGAKYQVALNDLDRKQCCSILANREKGILDASIQSYPQETREAVKLVSMDLSSYFRRLVEDYFPNAIVAADHFHAVRLANDALNEIRKDVQEKLEPAQRTAFKNARRILLSRTHALKPSTRTKLEVMLNLSDDLAHAYWLKEEYFDLFSSADRADFKQRLQSFANHVAEYGLADFKRLLRTTYQWKEEIWTGIQTGYSNGFTEGCNNTIKVIKRISFGFRNIKNFRRRILFVLNNPDRQKRRSKISKKVSHNR